MLTFDGMLKIFVVLGGTMTATYVYRLLRSGKLTERWEMKQRVAHEVRTHSHIVKEAVLTVPSREIFRTKN
jgi:hypothetical protein